MSLPRGRVRCQRPGDVTSTSTSSSIASTAPYRSLGSELQGTGLKGQGRQELSKSNAGRSKRHRWKQARPASQLQAQPCGWQLAKRLGYAAFFNGSTGERGPDSFPKKKSPPSKSPLSVQLSALPTRPRKTQGSEAP